MWIPMNILPWIDFVMMAPERPFTLVKWKDTCTRLWKESNPVLIWGRGHLCAFSLEENEKWWFLECWIWCAQQKDTSSDDVIAVGAPTEEPEWGCWTCIPDPLMSCYSLRKQGRSWWWLAIPNFLHKLPDLSESYLLWSLPKNTDCMFGSLSILYLGTQNSFFPVWCSFCCWNRRLENWNLWNFPSGGKRLVKAMEHYYGGKEWLKPLFRH